MRNTSDSELNYLISPEIKDDEFYQTIQRMAQNLDVQTVLEIGSSSGQGSTAAFVGGLRNNPNRPTLFCMEVSQPRFEALRDRYIDDEFVKCYNVSSVPVSDFPGEAQVAEFYQSTHSGLRQFRLEQVLGWLQQDIEYVQSARVDGNGIQHIKQDNGIEHFDLVLIDGSEFTGSAELDQVYGAKYILLDDICTYKNYEAHHRLLLDANYRLLHQNVELRNGYSVFVRADYYRQGQQVGTADELSVHFFTIVLNGEPFIHYHLPVLQQLPFRWHWHVVEGVAALKHDTAWSVALGGKVTDSLHRNGRSLDGTTEYLDQLARDYPEQVTVYRKPEGEFWDGKREMVSAPLANIDEACLLWQIDVDELWTVEQLMRMRQCFVENPDKTAAYFWCHYFVGEALMISTRHCYAQNPQQEWLRVWRFEPGAYWAAHEPPQLVKPGGDGAVQDLAKINPFRHHETEKEGLIFQHFAYVTPEQLRFKEDYYGYENAVSQWRSLQAERDFPVYLRGYFPWVQDDTLVEPADACGVTPLAQREPVSQTWQFSTSKDAQHAAMTTAKPFPQIVIDGVFFQFGNSGIAQVWRSLLERWSTGPFAQHIVVLDRDGTAPRIPNIRYRPVRAYDYDNTADDAIMLQRICDEKGADLFISSYYTTPLTTPSVFMGYDMIPEVIGSDLEQTGWKEKHYGIMHASGYITISESTARDLCKFFPHIPPEHVTVAHCGIRDAFSPADSEAVQAFKEKFGIAQPYFLTVGDRTGVNGYKNAILLFRALSKLVNKSEIEVVCVGGRPKLEAELAALAEGVKVTVVSLSDEDLSQAYTGALALVYPSRYEGFGLPIVEAMACGCPVITCRFASIPEVAGEAALYIDPASPYEMIDALYKVQNPGVRSELVEAGFEQCRRFSWEHMAERVAEALIKTGHRLAQTKESTSPVWGAFRKLQSQIKQVESDLTAVSEEMLRREALSTVHEPEYEPEDGLGDESENEPAGAPEAVTPVLQPEPKPNSAAQPVSSFAHQSQQLLLERIGKLRSRLEAKKRQLEQAQDELQQAKDQIAAMETSKFWRLRTKWFRVKQIMGLSKEA